MRSRTRRACCASTRCVSTCRGCSNAARIALGVISLNVTRKIFFGSVAAISFFGLAFAVSSAVLGLGFVFFLKREPLGSCSVNFAGLARTMARCAEMASPSRSGSPARYTASADLAALRRSLMTLPLPGDDLQRGLENLVVVQRNGGLRGVLALAFLLPFLPCASFSFRCLLLRRADECRSSSSAGPSRGRWKP